MEEEKSQEKVRSPSPPTVVDNIQEEIAQQTIPPDVLKKLAEAEEMVRKLHKENQSQREELDHIHSSLEREARMKYRGCNHPSKSFRLRHNSNSSSLDGSTRDMLSSSRTRNSSHDSQYVSMSRIDLSRPNDRFPPLRAIAVPRSRRQR